VLDVKIHNQWLTTKLDICVFYCECFTIRIYKNNFISSSRATISFKDTTSLSIYLVLYPILLAAIKTSYFLNGSLKISKGYSETVRRRQTNNAMTKRKRITNKQWSTKHYTEIERWSNTNPTQNRFKLRCPGRIIEIHVGHYSLFKCFVGNSFSGFFCNCIICYSTIYPFWLPPFGIFQL